MARKVSLIAARAFFKGQHTRKINNTVCTGDAVLLHGNCIAWRGADGRVFLTLAGWNTVTTRERLNTILRAFGFAGRFTTRKGVPHYDGKPADSRDVWQLN